MLGCDVGDPEHQPVDTPPVRLLSVTVTTGIDADGNLERAELSDGSTVALPSTSITLQFDRFIEAQDAIRQAVCIRSNTAPVDGPLECEGAVFLRPYYNPARRQLSYFQQDGEAELEPDTLYQLTVFSPTTDERFGIRAFDGGELEATVRFQFRTALAGGVSREKLPSGDLFCEPEACLAACTGDPDCETACGVGAKIALQPCTNPSCHVQINDLAAAMDLDLSDGRHVLATAIGRVANQTQTGENADVPVSSSLRFGRAMPIIDAGNPGNSYLLYKILAHESLAADDPTLLPGEVDRLRATMVVGAPMPIKPTPSLSQANASRIAEWIAAGADVSCDLPK